MIPLLLAGLLAAVGPAAIGPAAGATGGGSPEAPGTDGGERIVLAQMIFRSRVVVRVTTVPVPQRPVRENWSEKKGPRCVPMTDIAGAAVVAPGSVDLVMRGGDRVRARFGASCPGLDYYSGFYIVPPGDAQICADRDVVRDRAGGECAIDRFRALVPRK